jgi:hypothetical protein
MGELKGRVRDALRDARPMIRDDQLDQIGPELRTHLDEIGPQIRRQMEELGPQIRRQMDELKTELRRRPIVI